MSQLSTLPPTSAGPETLHWTARHGKPIIFVILILVAVGIYLAVSIPVAVFPSTDFPRIVVGADLGVYPIDQMLVTVTKPLEEAVNTVPGLNQVTSITSRGSAEIDLFFNWNVDMNLTLQLVNAAMTRIQPTLPANTQLTANRLTFAAFPILGYSLTSDRIPQTTLWETANYQMKPRLNRAAGVSSVVVQGGQVPEFQIQPDPAKLVQAGVTIPNILDAVARSNMIDSPGLIETNHQLVLTLMSGQAKSLGDIGNIVVKTTPASTAVHVNDVAKVNNSVMPVYTVVTANGKPAVLLNVYRQPNSNTVDVANAVHSEIANLKKSLPPGVQINAFYDQSELVDDAIKSVRDAILLGLILASLIMVLFLRDWGTSLVAGLVIPATIGVTFIALRLVGQSFNLMTLGGLAAAVGLVIDDAIVVVENIVMHRDSGQSRAEAIRSAIREIRVPLVGSTITPIVVFLPLISITGVTGVFFRALAITVGMALLTSLALALTWTPTLSHYFLRNRRAGASGPPGHESVPPWLMKAYERTLRFALEHPLALILFTIVLIAGSYLCYTHTGSDLLPSMDEGGFIVDYVMPPGASLASTNRVISHVEKILRGTPEVASIARRTGLQLGLAAVTEANTGDISVKLKPMAPFLSRLFGVKAGPNERTRSGDEVIADVRAKVKEAEPTLDVEFPQLLQDMIGDLTSAPQPVVIKLFSEDGDLLRHWAPVEASAIKKIPGVVDVEDGIENTTSGTAVTFNVDPVVTARAGFTPQEVELDASAMLQGEPASAPVVLNDRSYTIRVQFPPSARRTLDSMRNTLIVSGSGKTATIGSLATLTEIPGQTEIIRENLQRSVDVTARFEGINLGDGMAKVQKAVAESNLPPSIRVEYGGQYQEQQKSFRDLVFVLALAIVLVFMVLLFEFGEFAAPIAVLSSALLSTCGVFLALLITRTTFNLSSFMGLIMVVGIVAKNGILLLDADQKFRAEGAASEESMIRAGERRLRPIMMTALATVAGMLPLAFAVGAGSQMLQPLAIAVIGGILASMVLSLVVTPAVRFYAGGRN
ncbi:MAG TPA: efflux RND transporter permease subunit [Bryobacteraceae bacterium]|nr:efflux RND transporter permease subunit [Bryobacteraceae bacterium]